MDRTDIQQVSIFGLSQPRLYEIMQQQGMAKFRADQLLDWVYRRHVTDLQQMHNISKEDRQSLGNIIHFKNATIAGKQAATDGVRKLLVHWVDQAAQAECVLIPIRGRASACVSSQVGCPVGCRFCASGLGGLDGNLTAAQIVEQVWLLDEISRSPLLHAGSKQDSSPAGVTHVVFMGMGEPLANFEGVTDAVRILTASWGLNISARRITISTVGLPGQIRKLADLSLKITLAISIHAPNDELRGRLIPWAKRVSLSQLVEAGRYYFDKTGREVTLEYVLLGGVNDRPSQAKELAGVAKRLRSNVNLIRYNEVASLPFERPATEDVRQFQSILRKAGINTHIRASRGRDVAAACGQLRHESVLRANNRHVL
ncbi:MAG: 23S rRNA (adenine(2503)-C(2))-methyltransferase RlmN [Phycisphaeraceae bacterium]|nr:23S rRNA (adenine(2503)-C(2))-methyltransferase RlmN [Phycisphaeraceae bacterium]